MAKPVEKVKVIILKQTVAAKATVKKHSIHEFDASEANYLIAIKKAAPYSKELVEKLKIKEKETAPPK